MAAAKASAELDSKVTPRSGPRHQLHQRGRIADDNRHAGAKRLEDHQSLTLATRRQDKQVCHGEIRCGSGTVTEKSYGVSEVQVLCMTREFSDAGSLANECAEYRLVPTDRRQGFQEEFLILVTVHGTNAQDNARTARTGESECGGDLIAIVTIIGRRGRLGGQTARNHLDTPDNKAHGRELSTRGLRRRHDRINLGHDGEIGGGLFRRLPSAPPVHRLHNRRATESGGREEQPDTCRCRGMRMHNRPGGVREKA